MPQATGLTPFLVQFDFSDAFNGGSSLRVAGSLDQDTDVLLYLADIDVFADSKLVLAYKTGSAGATSMEAFITLTGAEGTRIPLGVGNSSGVGWNEVELDLGAYAGQTISSIGLRFLDNDDANYEALIGQLGVVRGARDSAAPAGNIRLQGAATPVSGAADQFEARLLWDHSPDHSRDPLANNVYYYNIYQEFSDGTRNHLGVTGGEGYWINDLVFEEGEPLASLIVEAVSLEFGRSETEYLLSWASEFGVDFDEDGDVTADDYGLLMQNMFAPPSSGLVGDLNGDNTVDFFDHQSFSELYDLLNGAGSFQAMITAVPEPCGAGLAGTLLVAAAAGRPRRLGNTDPHAAP